MRRIDYFRVGQGRCTILVSTSSEYDTVYSRLASDENVLILKRG